MYIFYLFKHRMALTKYLNKRHDEALGKIQQRNSERESETDRTCGWLFLLCSDQSSSIHCFGIDPKPFITTVCCTV